jgi:hypothetical protein
MLTKEEIEQIKFIVRFEAMRLIIEEEEKERKAKERAQRMADKLHSELTRILGEDRMWGSID